MSTIIIVTVIIIVVVLFLFLSFLLLLVGFLSNQLKFWKLFRVVVSTLVAFTHRSGKFHRFRWGGRVRRESGNALTD